MSVRLQGSQCLQQLLQHGCKHPIFQDSRNLAFMLMNTDDESMANRTISPYSRAKRMTPVTTLAPGILDWSYTTSISPTVGLKS